MATTDTTAEPGGPVPPPQSPKPPQDSRRRWPLRLLIIFLILLSAPAAVLACLALQDTSLSLRGSGSGATSVGCPASPAPFTDCYTRTRVSIEPMGADRQGALRICCDFVVERQSDPALSITLPANTGAGWSSAGRDLGATWTLQDLAAGGDAVSDFRYRQSSTPMAINVTLSGAPRTSLPLFGGMVSEQTTATVLAWIETFAARLPPIIGRLWITEPAPAAIQVFVAPPPLADDMFGRVGERDILRLSATVEVARSLLFGDQLTAAGGLDKLGPSLTNASVPMPERLRDRILELAQSGFDEPDREPLRQAAALINDLNGVTVSRLSRITEEIEQVAEAGRRCAVLYQNLRASLSRLDAALVTYATALPTGLLTQLRGQFDHGCNGAAETAGSRELTEDWRALGIELPGIETALEGTSTPTAEPADSETESKASNPARRPGRFLLTIASAAKSGASLDQLKAALAETLKVRIGETGRFEGRARGDVIRMLRRQWSHAGCWLYDTGDGAGTLTLHVEAQFPYLNHIAFRRAKNGLITAVEITGVSLRDLSTTKRRNHGIRCQAFLNPIRIADYAFWLKAEGDGARTPVDHALRLLKDGPGPIGTLKLR
jgi:hypothetical protein